MDGFELASEFKPLPGEANFPPTITREVKGGMHIAPECVTVLDGQFIMTVWPDGLPRHETERTARFPHGLMQFGETMQESAERLVKAQLGLSVESVRVLEVDSYVDDANHWHLEPLLLVHVKGSPAPPADAEATVTFEGVDLPDASVWSEESFRRIHTTYLVDTISAG